MHETLNILSYLTKLIFLTFLRYNIQSRAHNLDIKNELGFADNQIRAVKCLTKYIWAQYDSKILRYKISSDTQQKILIFAEWN